MINRIKQQILSLHHIFDWQNFRIEKRTKKNHINSTEKVANKFKPRYSVYRLTHASIVLFLSPASTTRLDFRLFLLVSSFSSFSIRIIIIFIRYLRFIFVTSQMNASGISFCFLLQLIFKIDISPFVYDFNFPVDINKPNENIPAFEIVSWFNAKPNENISYDFNIASFLPCLV